MARIVIAILATIGVIDTGSITLSRFGWISPLSCPGSSEGCDQVLNSAWGTIFEINSFEVPLSFIGLLSYLAILILAIIPFFPGLTGQKVDLSRSAWWGLFIISNCMTIFSFLLMGIMIIKIQSLCFFCILSAILSTLILVITLFGGGWEEPRELIFRGILISIFILLSGLIWSSSVDPNRTPVSTLDKGIPPLVISKSTPSSISLAEHLTKIGAIQYSAYWCPHCHDQKEIFGNEAAEKLTIIECAADGKDSQLELCQIKGISGFPSWEINGRIDSGVKSLNELADLSNYKGSRDF